MSARAVSVSVVRPVLAAVRVLAPSAGPSVQLPTVALPLARVVWMGSVMEPLPVATANVTLPIGDYSLRLRVSDNRGGVGESDPLTFSIVAPAAEIEVTRITPISGRRGATVSTVVEGTGFTPGCYVTVNGGGVNVTTTFVSATRLNAVLSISGNTQIGPRAITVTRPTGVAGTSPSRIFTILTQ